MQAPVIFLAIAAATTAAGATYSYVQQQKSAKYQEKVALQNAEFQRKLTAANLARAKLESLASEQALRNQQRRRIATLTTAIAASGAGYGGSPLEIVADSAKQSRLGLEYLKMNNAQREYDAQLSGQVTERRYLFEAQGAAFERQAAFGTLLGGYGQAAGIASQAFSAYKTGGGG